MKAIEGKVGKSIILEQIIKENADKKILIIDTIGISKMLNGVFVLKYNSNEQMWNDINSDKFKTEFINEGFDLLVFETNDTQSNITNYRHIENKIGKPVIVTVQNNDLDKIRTWELLGYSLVKRKLKAKCKCIESGEIFYIPAIGMAYHDDLIEQID